MTRLDLPRGTIRDWLVQRAREEGERRAFTFTDGGEPFTWRSLREEAGKIAKTLTAENLAKGDSVAIVMPNGRDALAAFFGCVYGGFRATMINLVAGDEAIGYALRHCGARTAFVGPQQHELFNRVRPDGVSEISPDASAGDVDLHRLTPEDDALLMYTSGTTGRPKGVRHSHSSLLAGGWTTALAHDLAEADRGYCVLPIYHINGLCVTVMGALVSGGSLVMAPKFSAQRFWADIDTHECTWFSVVPTIISHLLHGETAPKGSSLRFGRSASSALAPDVQTGFEARFDVPIVETMGLTETAAQILSNPLPPATRKTGSPGIAYGNEVQIADGQGTRCGAGVTGEIMVRGPNVMRGYLDNPEATAEAFSKDGWLRTGDLGHINRDGFVFVTGRLKELIIKGGENIAPREIDDVLYSDTTVLEAAAFARPCRAYGERVEAAVSLSGKGSFDEQALIDLCREKLGAFKAPDRIHVLDELPKGPSGKIQRLKLAELIPPAGAVRAGSREQP